MKVYSVLVPGMADEIGVQVQEDGTALNLWEDGTAGVPEDVREAAEELFEPDSHPVIGETEESYNPGKPGRTWDDVFQPDSEAPRFYADVSGDTTLVVEWDEGWHLWQITKIEGDYRGHHHLDGPFTWFSDVQDKAVEVFDRIADEKATAGPESGTTMTQTFNIGDDDETDTLVMYGVPRHELDDPAALRRRLVDLYTERQRFGTILMRMWPLARTRAEQIRKERESAQYDLSMTKSGTELHLRTLGRFAIADHKIIRFEEAQAGARELDIPEKEFE